MGPRRLFSSHARTGPSNETGTYRNRGIRRGRQDLRCRDEGARRIDEPAGLWPRDPPIRYRAKIPTSWIELKLREGKNRQVRRMTARVGFPTLRLVRAAIGGIDLTGLAPGEWREVAAADLE